MFELNDALTTRTPALRRPRLVRHLRIAWQFVRIGVIRKSQFRVEFVNQVFMDCVFYFTHILVFEFLYRLTPSIAGWELAHARVYLGFLFIADAFMMVWLGQAWLFTEDLKKGNLDFVRVRPASAIFLYFYQRFSLEGLVNMTIAMGYLVYAVVAARLSFSAGLCLDFVWAVALAWWGRSVLMVLFSIAEFYFLNSDLARFAQQLFDAVNDYPLDIFTLRMRQFLLFLVPVGALSYLPACFVLGRMDTGAKLFHSGWMLAAGWTVFALWRASFRRYESALS